MNPRRCQMEGCKKKLAIVASACKCGLTFCSKHTLPEFHKCNYDFKKDHKKLLEEANQRVVGDKIIRI